MESHSIYIHIPFCIRRCSYCDFITFAGMEDRIEDYVDALCHEIELVCGTTGQTMDVHSIYFGGGTPSLLKPMQIEKIIDKLDSHFVISKQAEISMEANPGTLTYENLSQIHKAGVNRISLGAQSSVTSELNLLGRIHGVEEIVKSFTFARQAGFDNISMDFIYGLPGQKSSDWQKSLDFAISLHPEHLSMYALTLDEATPMAKMIARGELPALDEDLAAELYENAMDCLVKAGYHQYEISNWASLRNGTLWMCIHNLQYWRNLPYLGFGVGAHGFTNKIRTANVETLPEYLELVHIGKGGAFPYSPANATHTIVSEKDSIQEALMVGLRLTIEGVARSIFLRRYQIDFYTEFKRSIDQLTNQGLVEWIGNERDVLRLTRRGRLLGNLVFLHFVGEQQNQ